MKATKWIIPLLGVLISLGGVTRAESLGSAFTYQGKLTDGGQSAQGNYDLRFILYDAATDGHSVAGPVTNSPVAVNNGLFTTSLDFGAGLFTGEARWLEIGVRANGDTNDFMPLSPRQPLTAAPYAAYAPNAGSAASVVGIVPVSRGGTGADLSHTGGANQYVRQLQEGAALSAGAISAGDLPIHNHSGADLTSGTVPWARLPSDLVTNQASGVTLNGAFNGNGAALTNLNAAMLNGLAAAGFWQLGGNNIAAGQFLGSTNNQAVEIWAGGQRALRMEPNAGSPNVIGGASMNVAAAGAHGAFIGGGSDNAISANYSVVAGGIGNVASNDYTFVGGGLLNGVCGDIAAVGGGGYNNAAGFASVISGGYQNQAQSSFSAVGGGYFNAATNGADAVVAGGWNNTASGRDSAVGGGEYNEADGQGSTVAGGDSNTADGQYAAIPGGVQNKASGMASFAAGSYAQATHNGSFVWGDSSINSYVSSKTANSWTVRASGSVWFFSNTNLSAGVFLAPGGTAWSTFSDRNAKKNFAPVDSRAVLDQLARVPVQRWNYQWESDDTPRHLGPMAQDFKSAFYPGTDDKSITTQEFDGVTLAAIQGLNQKLEEKSAALEKEVAELKALVKTLAAQVTGSR
ncbi:MAG: tail fiber domain-containing protein [Verrucomicrobia bacterium]|nr:tail fiber domain-containing protein [Verrucomicrobiota bacterium]